MQKTNVMRILDQHKITYTPHCYIDSGVVSGTDVAKVLNQNPENVFKTLVTRGKTGSHYVFVIPVEKDLNLKSSLYIYNRLKELGVNAMLTRDSDISLPKNERIKKVKKAEK